MVRTLSSLALAIAALTAWPVAAAAEPARSVVVQRGADFGRATPSAPARRVADWAVRSGDHKGLPFAVIDKPRARLYVFDERGRLRGTSPVLLGLARGDHTVEGIGERELADIKPHERTTPAGRFIAERGRNHTGEDLFWIDYDAAVSLHRVRSFSAAERRLERLATPTAADNRISYGCVNVPTAFYEQVVDRTLRERAVVYVLPDQLPLDRVFGFGDPPPKPRVAAR